MATIYLFLHRREEKGKPGSSTGKRKGVKDHGQIPPRAVCGVFPALACSKVYAPNLNLPSRPAEVRGQPAAPFLLLP